MKREISLLDLFSGTGGFARGLLASGFIIKKHQFSEIDKYSIANYQYNFKNAKNLGDITKINTSKIEHPDIICFGSPCQDISIAGKRKGLKGKRSSLFFEAIRIIRECRPDVFIFENVKGLFSSNQGKDFEVILQTFADLGLYDIEWQLLNTCWFLPQNRERVYVVGHLRSKTRQQIFPIGESSQGRDEISQKKSQGKTVSPTIDTKVGESTHRSPYVLHWKGSSTKWKYDQMKTSPALNTQQDWIRQPLIASGIAYRTRNYKGQGGNIEVRKDKVANQLTTAQKDSMVLLREITKNQSEGMRLYESKNSISRTLKSMGGGMGAKTGLYKTNLGIRRLTPIECERLQGFPDNWTSLGVFDGEQKEISDSQRYKMLGNAVTVPVVSEIGKRMIREQIQKQESSLWLLEMELELMNFKQSA
jgi:DNA (cytosine-5)-methyltransferase 1